MQSAHARLIYMGIFIKTTVVPPRNHTSRGRSSVVPGTSPSSLTYDKGAPVRCVFIMRTTGRRGLRRCAARARQATQLHHDGRTRRSWSPCLWDSYTARGRFISFLYGDLPILIKWGELVSCSSILHTTTDPTFRVYFVLMRSAPGSSRIHMRPHAYWWLEIE